MGYRIKNKHYMNLQYIVIYIRENWKKFSVLCVFLYVYKKSGLCCYFGKC